MIGRGFFAVHVFELVLLRHGRTAWNADGRFQGHTDVPLDGVGRAQARGLATLLAGERFDLGVSSDLKRAWETAAIVLAGRAPAVLCDERWREMQFGAWEGLTWPQIVERYPELAAQSAVKPKFYTPAGGESFGALCVRIGAALAAIDARIGDNARVLVATHAGPLHALLRVAFGDDEATALEVRFLPASLTRVRFEPRGARIVEINRIASPAAL